MFFANFNTAASETLPKSTWKSTIKRSQITTAKEAHKGLIMAILDFPRNNYI